MEKEFATLDVVREFAFEGRRLPVFEVNGKPHWIAKQVGAALGYEDGGELVRMISRDWTDDLRDGKDRCILRGKKLKAFKELVALGGESAPSRAPSLMLLTESGVTIAAVMSKKPAGKRMRRWLADEVLPQIVRDGQFSPDRRVVDGKLTMSADMASMLAEAQRLLAKVQVSQDKAAVLRGEAMRRNATTRQRQEQARAHEQAGRARSAAVPEQEIREVAERLGLHDDPRMSRPARIA